MDLCHKIENDHSSDSVSVFLLSVTQYVDMSKPHYISIQTIIYTMLDHILCHMAAVTKEKTTSDFEITRLGS